jgi:glycosyltransferase involved in cell wall biosynthesis
MRLLLLHCPAPIVRELAKRDFELVSCNSSASFNTHDQLPLEFAPRQRTINISGRKKICRPAIRVVRELIESFRPDIVHAFVPDSLAWSLFATWGMKDPPKIISFRGISRIPNRWDPSDWISYLSSRVSLHACESQAVRSAMIHGGITPERCIVTYNTMWEYESPKTRQQWRTQWGVADHEVLLGTVGTIRHVKGTDLLISAAEKLPASLPWRLIIMGSIVDQSIFQQIASSPIRNRIIITGEEKFAVSAMHAMDLFVMPSRSEGLCRALIEACSVGLCPIVSDAGGMKELVRHQLDGWVFERENTEELTDALVTLIEDAQLRSRFAQSAREHVTGLCGKVQVTDRLIEIYKTAIETPSRR